MSEMQARTADAVARVAAATAVAETLLAAVLAHGNGVTLRAWTESNLASGALLALGFATTAVFVVRHDTHNALGWLFLVMAHLHAATVLASEWAYRQLASGPPDGAVVTAAWVGSNAWWVALLLLAGLVPLLFPDGRLPSPRWRPVAAVAVTAIVVGAVAGVGSGALVVEAFPTVTVRAPLGSVPEALTTGVAVGGVLVALLCGVTGLVGIALRLRRADARERGRLSWFLVACLSLVLVEMLPPQPWSGLVANLLFPAALGVAIVRHGLYDGDRLLSRTLVYGLLTGAVLAALGLGAATVGRGVAGSSGGVVLAALVVALGLRPLHRLVQGAVDRALYGGRRDPYLALRSVSTHLSHQPDGGDPLEAVAQSVAQSLRAPRAEVLLDPDTGAQPDGAGAVDVPLTFGGRGVGTLRVHLRKGRTRLDPADVDLLADLTPQVAVAVRTTTLLEEARRSRERLLLAVEDERRRIRRDLHDGLGPALAGVSLGLSTVAGSASRGDVPGAAVLERLERQARGCLDDVQQIVHGLRPSALDGLGLMGALREHAESLTVASRGAFTVQVHGEAGPTPLPAAIELAAYRVAMEAMTNAAVHSRAGRCDVEVVVNGHGLRVEVSDDGIGLAAANGARRGSGMGLRSIADRADELGGTSDVESSADGTRVRLCLPLEVAP